MTQARLKGEQTLITHVYMWTGARHMLELAEASQLGRSYTATASLLYSAFTLEAYFNHLGGLLFPDWQEIERRLSKARKFRRLAEKAGVPLAANNRPQLTMNELFSFRDGMAHGRDVSETVDQDIEWTGLALPHIETESQWHAFATPQRARDAIADVETLIRQLHSGCGQTQDPFARRGAGVFGIARLRDDGPPPSRD